MSPRIGISVRLADIVPVSDRPLDILRAAFRAAVSMGLRIRAQEEPGVELAALGGTWRTTHHRRETNLAGAVCMVYQPAALSREDQPDVTAARALRVTWMWVVGCLDGFARDVNPELLTGADQAAYKEGMWDGATLRTEVTVECPVCEERRLPVDDDCKCTSARRR
jgi:hypothetical protein